MDNMVTPLADIRPVNDKKSWNDFIHLPWQLYQDDPNWVPPLLMEIQDRLNPEKNPYFEHAKMQAWVAYEDARPVGRITAQLDELVYKYHGEKTGHFGFLCIVVFCISQVLVQVVMMGVESPLLTKINPTCIVRLQL